jgi:amidophosphoribosyltransferase
MEADKFKDACGVFGLFAPGEDVSKLTYFGLYALQHRGQESAGIAVSDDGSILIFKDMGLVSQVFDEAALLSLSGKSSIGHVRYSTTGSSLWENAQPVHASFKGGSIALAHNGNITNSLELHAKLAGSGFKFRSTSDTEIIGGLISLSSKNTLEEAVAEAMKSLEGAFSLLILSEDKLIGARDPRGIRPLSIGKLAGGRYVLSSETCALDTIGAKFVDDVKPGEIVSIDETGIARVQAVPAKKQSICIFEFIYFARPDSVLLGKSLYKTRVDMGGELAKNDKVEADLVVGVPDSGTPAAIGYAKESGIPYGEGMIKNRYIGRTFIQPTQTLRQQGIGLKLNPLKDIIKGKRLVVVDDSIVRGNTSKKIVGLLREAGALEVHMRISSPPVSWPCYYGIDTAEKSELIASDLDVESVSKAIGSDSLKYLTLERLVKATGCSKNIFCVACFNGCYPVSNQAISKFALETSD